MARPSLVRRLGAASLIAALALFTAACGSEDTSATDASASDTSASDTSNSDTSNSASGDLEELSADEFYPAVSQALQDAETMGFSVTTSGGASSLKMTGEMRYTADGVDMSAASTGSQSMEMVILDKTLYIAGAGLPIPEGKKWVKVDLSDPNSIFGQLGKSMDPSTMFKAIEAPKKFELLGTEEVDGVETNHYNIVMDTAAYAGAMDLPADVVKMMPKEIGLEMWVDADNQPRKFHQELEIPSTDGSGAPTKTTTEGTYFDFGEDVDVTAPPAADVADNVPGIS